MTLVQSSQMPSDHCEVVRQCRNQLQQTTTRERPFVTLSWAQSLDALLAVNTTPAPPISSPGALAMTHRIRACHDGILIGKNTALTDNPKLTVRYAKGPNPQRILLDSQLEVPLSSTMFTDSSPAPWVAIDESLPTAQRKPHAGIGCQLLPLPRNSAHLCLRTLLTQLHQAKIRSLMVEGGSTLLRSFLDAGLADFVVITIAPRILGQRGSAPILSGQRDTVIALEDMWQIEVDKNIVIGGRPITTVGAKPPAPTLNPQP